MGAFAVSDAAYLPGGRCVVALGEAGVRLLSRDGRTVAHFDQPATDIVPRLTTARLVLRQLRASDFDARLLNQHP